MNRIVMLGSSPAAVKAIEEIRTNGPSGEITLFLFDDHYPYKRDVFPSFIAKEISSKDIFYKAKDFYQQHNVNVILNRQISRINVKRKKIFTEDKKQLDYDFLIIAETPENRFPSVKGTGKNGVFGYKKFKDIDHIMNILPIIDTVAVQSDSFSGLQAAASFAKRGKEVILVTSGKDFLSGHFETETAQWFIRRLGEKGLKILSPNVITEVLGDGDAKAVRLGSGKVFSAQAVLFVEMDEDLRIFADSGLQMHKKITVDQWFKTNIDNIFAVDQVCILGGPGRAPEGCETVVMDSVMPVSVLEEQGKVVAAALNGQERLFGAPVLSRSLDLEGLSVTVLGQTETCEGVTVRRRFDQGSGAYQVLFLKGNCLIGAVLVNAEQEKEKLLRLIRERGGIGLDGDEPVAGNTGPAECDSEDISTELVDK